MGVSKFIQPDYAGGTQSGSAYPAAIDASVAVMKRGAAAFAAHESDTPDMRVQLDAGIVPAIDGLAAEIAAQQTAVLVAPAADPRNDIVWIGRATGAVGVAAGAEAAVPADPALPAGKVPVARVRLTVGMTEITNADLDDLRDGFAGLGEAAARDAADATLAYAASFFL
jgi:hypothetical protein